MDAFTPVITLHALTALTAVLLGPVQILRRRRDGDHRVLGAVWVTSIVGIRRGSVEVHRGFMVGSYLGTLTAFAVAALVPARLIPRLLRDEPLIALVTVLGVGVVVAVLAVSVVRAQPPTGTRTSWPPVPTSSV